MDLNKIAALGLMSPQAVDKAKSDALTQTLFNIGSAFRRAGAPSRVPGGQPLNLAPAFQGYQNSLANSVKQALMLKQLERQEAEHKRKEAQRKSEMASRQMIADRFATDTIDPIGTGDFEGQPSQELQSIPPQYRNLIEIYAQTKPPVKDFVFTLSNALKSVNSKIPTRPMSVKEWEYYNQLPVEDQTRYLELRRAHPVRDAGDRLVEIRPGGETRVIQKGVPPEQEPNLKERQKQSEVAGTAAGKIQAAKTPGSPENIEEQSRLSSIRARGVTQEASTNRRIGFINDAIKILKDTPGAAGMIGKVTKNIPSPIPGQQNPAFTLSELLKSIKANVGFDELQKLREMSPTGGALGQVAVQELEYLQALLGSLEQGLDDKTLIKNLSTMRDRLLELQKFRAKEIASLKDGSPLNTEAPKHLFKKIINYDSKGNRID